MKFLWKGSSLIEILLAIGIAAIFIPALAVGILATRDGQVMREKRFEAQTLIKESLEAVRVVRARGWSAFSVNGTYHPSINGTTWSLASGEEVLGNGFTRRIEISDVYRDTSQAIVASGGTLDLSTKRVVHTVSWTTPTNASVSTTTYMTRYLESEVHVDTTAAEFSAGDEGSPPVSVTNLYGGEVTLGLGGGAGWCNPLPPNRTYDLPKSGVANAISAIEGHVFAGTGENSSGVAYARVNISNADPPVPSPGGTVDGYKTNDIFGEANHGYIATDTNSSELVILDLTTNPFTPIGSFDATGPTDSTSIFVTNNTGYLIQGNVLWNVNLDSRTGTRTSRDADGIILAGTGTSVVVVGNYAYVTIASTTTQMQIFDVSNSSAMTKVKDIQISGAGQGRDVYVNPSGTRAYLALSLSAGKELYIIDITSESNPIIDPAKSYDTGSMDPRAVTAVPGNKVILVGHGGEEYHVVNVTNESSPTSCGNLNIDSGINDVDSVMEADGDAYSYVLTGDASSELKIIKGGSGGNFSTTGTFISDVIDPGLEAAYNRLSFTADVPALTTLSLQVGVADAINGSCSGVSYSFVGPDGTSGSYFRVAAGEGIPFHNDGTGYENPGRCFKYKADFSTPDILSSPVLYDVSVNYSP